MKIKKNSITTTTLPASTIVNRVGKYLYNHLDGAFKFQTSSNTFDVYTTVLYQLPRYAQIPGKGPKYNDVHEMVLNLSITTYVNKVRVNIIEVSPEEKTIGFDVYEPSVLMDLEEAKRIIFQKVCKRISKAYQDYYFLF